MKHIQYYFIVSNSTDIQKSENKVLVFTDLNVKNFLNNITIENNVIIDVYIFGCIVNNKFYHELDSFTRMEDLCAEFDKACIQSNIDRNSINLNIVYISQLMTVDNDDIKKIQNTRIDDVFNYVHPYYATITKIFMKDKTIDQSYELVYNFSDPIDCKNLAKLVKMLKPENITGLYYTPNFEQADSLSASVLDNLE